MTDAHERTVVEPGPSAPIPSPKAPDPQEETNVTMAPNVDWAAWVERWDRQQEASLYDRDGRFALMFDLVERQRGGRPLRLLDLCCGCGSISARALRRFPAATVLAVDLDPLLLEMGRRTLGADGPVEWREADLRRDDWAADLAPGSFDAVLTATALHWFQADALVRLFGTLAPLLADGGLFLNADHLPTGAPSLDALVKGMNEDWRAGNVAAGAETGMTIGRRWQPSRRWPTCWPSASAASPTACGGPPRPSVSTARRSWRPASARSPRSGAGATTPCWRRCAEAARHPLDGRRAHAASVSAAGAQSAGEQFAVSVTNRWRRAARRSAVAWRRRSSGRAR